MVSLPLAAVLLTALGKSEDVVDRGRPRPAQLCLMAMWLEGREGGVLLVAVEGRHGDNCEPWGLSNGLQTG